MLGITRKEIEQKCGRYHYAIINDQFTL